MCPSRIRAQLVCIQEKVAEEPGCNCDPSLPSFLRALLDWRDCLAAWNGIGEPHFGANEWVVFRWRMI